MFDILIDADMVLDALINRVGDTDDLFDIWEIPRFNSIQGYVTDLGLAKILRVIKKLKGIEAARVVDACIRSRLGVYATTELCLHRARNIDAVEYESAVEIVCALQKPFGAIVTAIPHHFECSDVMTLSVDELVSRRRLEEMTTTSVVVLPGSDLTFSLLNRELEHEFIREMDGVLSTGNLLNRGASAVAKDFSCRQLDGAKFPSARLASAKFTKSSLRSADLCGTYLYEANFSYADLRYADLTDAKLVNANLISANLQHVKANRSDFSHARLRAANLQSSELNNSCFRRADLSSADLRHVFLNDSNLSKAILNGARLVGASLFYANLQKASLAGADLQNANLIKADLRDADLSGCCLDGCQLADADLRGAILCGVDLQKVDLSKSKLSPLTMIEENCSQIKENHLHGSSRGLIH